MSGMNEPKVKVEVRVVYQYLQPPKSKQEDIARQQYQLELDVRSKDIAKAIEHRLNEGME